MKISNDDKIAIKNLITETEMRTSCEVVPMVVRSSDSYPAAQFRSAILVSFLFSLGVYYSPLNLLNPIYFLWSHLLGLCLGYFLGLIPGFKRIFITRDEMDLEVTQRAHEAFLNYNLHHTKNRSGLLIFISRFEHKIKIITDSDIKSKIDNTAWNDVVSNFVIIIRNENLITALKAAIRSTGDILEKHFPATEGRSNELKNDLIIE